MTSVPPQEPPRSDLLAGRAWECAAARAGSESPDPTDPPLTTPWRPATVPGTVAGALLDAGDEVALLRDYDRDDWWFRVRFEVPEPAADAAGGTPYALHLGGLAVLADVWLDGEHLLRSENMFVAHDLEVRPQAGAHVLSIRCASITHALRGRRPRPRWRTVRLDDQKLRHVRTTMTGRMSGRPATPAPVGPWRPVTLTPVAEQPARVVRLHASVDGDRGRVEVRVVTPAPAEGPVRVRVGSVVADAEVHDGEVRAVVEVSDVELWWPHPYGEQPLYDVELLAGGSVQRLGRVGFRTVEVDRHDGAFTVRCNGVEIFARGTNWMPLDPTRLAVEPDRLRRNVELLREGQHSMVRLPGSTLYPDRALLDLLDEAGVLLWHDCMLAFVDLPTDDDFVAGVRTELTQALTTLQGHPCLAVVCGSCDTEEQGQYLGAPAEAWASPLVTETIPALVEELLPGTAYLRSTPGGSPLPTATSAGVTHYFGVTGYLRPLDDVRRAAVRFATECLPVTCPSEPFTPAEEARRWAGLGPHPDPRHAVHRDSAIVRWDMEDCRDWYVRELFGVDAAVLRQQDPQRADLVFRACAVELFERLLSEWRRPGSPCAGALTLNGHDLLPGPGLGMVDTLDRPKASWFAMRRLCAPLAVLTTDEGFDGLGIHLVNDTAGEVAGTLRVDLYRDGETLLESARTPVTVPARGAVSPETSRLFEGFRDLSWSYRFGPPAADVVAVSLLGPDEDVLAQAVHLPAGPVRTAVPDLGLSGDVEPGPDGRPAAVRVRTRLFAQWVRLELDGWTPADSWFHLLPGDERVVPVRPTPLATVAGAAGADPARVTGRVGAYNTATTVGLHQWTAPA